MTLPEATFVQTLVGNTRFERVTSRVSGERSKPTGLISHTEHVARIELAPPVWKTGILILLYVTCIYKPENTAIINTL